MDVKQKCDCCFETKTNFVKYNCNCNFNICDNCFSKIKNNELDYIKIKDDEEMQIDDIFSYRFFNCSVCKKLSTNIQFNFLLSYLINEYSTIANTYMKNKKTYGERRKSKLFNKIFDEKTNDYILCSKFFEYALENKKIDFIEFTNYFKNEFVEKYSYQNSKGFEIFKQYINYLNSK